MVQRTVEPERDARSKPGHDGERRPRRRRDRRQVPVRVGPQEATVQGDHLAVQAVERSQAQVAMCGQLAERQVALEVAGEQGVERRDLEERAGAGVGARGPPAHRRHVERVDQPVVDQVGLHGGGRR